MKKALVAILPILFSGTALLAQQPVHWTYSAKKISDRTYEVHLRAAVDDGWHIYAPKQPENFIGTPTSIQFIKNPLVVISGEPVVKGELVKKKEPTLGIESWEYLDQVDFVQQISLKANIKTNVNGTIAFQVCTDEKCLQPTKVNFSVALD